MEVQLPVTTKAKLFFLPWKKSSHPQEGQDESQHPEFLLYFKVQSFRAHRRLLSGVSPHPGSLACSRLLSTLGSLLEPACGDHVAHGHVGTGESIFDSLVREHMNAPEVHHQVGKRDKEAPPQRPWAMWLLTPHNPWREQTSTLCKSRSQARESHEPLKASLFLPLGLY